MEEKKEEGLNKVGEIDLGDYSKESTPPPKGETPPGEVPEGEEPSSEEPDFVEVSLSTQMLIGMVGFALSMRYLPDQKAVKAFNEKYREDLPKVIDNFGMREVFDEVLGSTLSFKIKKTDILAVPLPGWVGLAAVLSVLVISGLVIKVPTTKGKVKEHKHVDADGEKGLTEEYKKKEPKE